MSEITRVGADLAKRVIQVHGVDAGGKLVTNRALPRDKFIAWCAQLPAGCLVAMEASSSAHHWARKLATLGLDARIIAAHLVAPYRLQGKGELTGSVGRVRIPIPGASSPVGPPNTPVHPIVSFSIRRLKPPASSRSALAEKMLVLEVSDGLQIWKPYGISN